MEEENVKKQKTNKGLWIALSIALVIGVIVIGSIYIFKEKEIKNSENLESNFLPEESVEDKSDNQDIPKYEEENYEEENYEEKDITLNFEEYADNKDYIYFEKHFFRKLAEDKYVINVTIDNIKINNNTYSVMLKNYNPNDYSCEKGVENVLYFNNKVVFSPFAEQCYLSMLSEMFVLNNKYLILHYAGELGRFVLVFDENGTQLEFEDDIGVFSIEEIKDNYVIYTGIDENCYINKYKMQVDGKITNTLLEKGTSVIDEC